MIFFHEFLFHVSFFLFCYSYFTGKLLFLFLLIFSLPVFRFCWFSFFVFLNWSVLVFPELFLLLILCCLFCFSVPLDFLHIFNFGISVFHSLSFILHTAVFLTVRCNFYLASCATSPIKVSRRFPLCYDRKKTATYSRNAGNPVIRLFLFMFIEAWTKMGLAETLVCKIFPSMFLDATFQIKGI